MIFIYPVYPSAFIIFNKSVKAEVIKEIDGIKNIFVNRDGVIIPESYSSLIELLSSKYECTITTGWGREYEFATKATLVGVPDGLIRLGQDVYPLTNDSADEMIRSLSVHPADTVAKWLALFRRKMEINLYG
ncbi:hypothetical protein HLB25_10350 [Dickeya dadantii]|uniref:hypothetical protein n=1 Tax=Dickeya dadantii TaxID=204038 RepID=UPI00149619BB|nr:hypothetical protein [Dickeya dadantii]NPE55910.1 hypothetical protein [Dickeya dadantii]NPE67134.1 hypothetical protein [Dickeya dadantii]